MIVCSGHRLTQFAFPRNFHVSDPVPVESTPQAAELPGLPPVEPPSAGFIVQLFIVPAIIVVVIVMVWLSFSWLAHIGEDPSTYIRKLKNRDWHAAYNLAQSLAQSQSNKALVENKKFAQEVAGVLQAELATESYEPDMVMFRRFLCISLGYFHVDTGLPVLIEAAETQRDDREIPVRCAALEAIVQLMLNLQKTDPPQNLDRAELLTMLTAAAKDDARFVEPADEQNKLPEKVWSVCERAVFAIGLLGTDPANEQLTMFLDSSEPNVRFNAATGLARHGIATERSIAVMVEMLEPIAEGANSAESIKHQIVLRGALPAIEMIVASDTTANLTPLEAPLQTLSEQTANKEAQLTAKALLTSLSNRKTP
jgi:hypothetical protein